MLPFTQLQIVHFLWKFFCRFALLCIFPQSFLKLFFFFALQPPQVNGGGGHGGAMFDSYNFGHTVSPEVGGGNRAVTPGDNSPKAEEAFATFEEHSPFGAPVSPQPKVCSQFRFFNLFETIISISLIFWIYYNYKSDSGVPTSFGQEFCHVAQKS